MKHERHRAHVFVSADAGGHGVILQALQYLQARTSVRRLSSFFELAPRSAKKKGRIGVACEVDADDSVDVLSSFLRWVERRMEVPHALPVSAELLAYDGRLLGDMSPHAAAALIDIAPQLFSGQDFSVPKEVRPIKEVQKANSAEDVQERCPTVPIVLSRVGITDVRRIIRLDVDGEVKLFYANLDLFAQLDSSHSGIHMSRFSDALEEVVEEVTKEPSPDIESLAERLVRQVVRRQNAAYAEVRIRAHFPLRKVTPASAKRVEELYEFIGMASSDADKRVKRVSGVEVDGMTVCPCAQGMMAAYAEELLVKEGYSQEEAKRIVEIFPVPSHNQRARGTLLVGSPIPIKAENLVHIVEASMSSEIYELLKRPDEFFVVKKAHENPRFVEDVVREMLRNVIGIFPELPDESFVLARTESSESIHQHNAFAERSGYLGDIRRELSSSGVRIRGLTLEEYLRS
ncbi:MAG TPA: GTP cyclohydrolase MptA [Thermosynergistes sp.]|nr:GTP cyclohydrolase MptA [Thermosynergistes sp.]